MENKQHGRCIAFNYSVNKLIDLVKMYPILWDCRHSGFRSFSAKEKVWRDIYVILDDKYRSADPITKADIASRITGKWRNIRDAFIRSFKKRERDHKVKRYMYHDRLSFMLKSMSGNVRVKDRQRRRASSNSDSTTENFTESCISYSELTEEQIETAIKHEPQDEEADCKIEIEDNDMQFFDDDDSNTNTRHGGFNFDNEGCNRVNVRRIDTETTQQEAYTESVDVCETLPKDQSSERKELSNVLNRSECDINTSLMPDEDEAFFASTLSLVRDMTQDEKLEFRMTVLHTIHQIRFRKRSSETKKTKPTD